MAGIVNSGSLSNTSGTAFRGSATTTITNVSGGFTISYNVTDINQGANWSGTSVGVPINTAVLYFLTWYNPLFASTTNSLSNGAVFFDRGLSTNISYGGLVSGNIGTMQFIGLIYVSVAQSATFGTSIHNSFSLSSGTANIFAGRNYSGIKMG